VEKLAPHSVTFVKELSTIAALVNSDSSELLNSYFSLLTSPQDRKDPEIHLEGSINRYRSAVTAAGWSPPSFDWSPQSY
jgi:hypothetical protein